MDADQWVIIIAAAVVGFLASLFYQIRKRKDQKDEQVKANIEKDSKL